MAHNMPTGGGCGAYGDGGARSGGASVGDLHTGVVSFGTWVSLIVEPRLSQRKELKGSPTSSPLRVNPGKHGSLQ